MTDFPKQYAPKTTEGAVQNLWETQRAFSPKKSTTGNTFYIPIPPPNVTGNLHIGHALTLTIQDIMIRYHRMLGDETVWIPGTDHAGIATQARVEKRLGSEGKNRKEIGRKAFLEESWKWMDEYKTNINEQIKKMGALVDWDKERFTFDEKSNDLVEKTFVDLYEKGIIYRGEYMVNYSPKLESVISDIEVDYEEVTEKMYYINYFVSGSDREILIATTRPETLLADQAVAVHPKDKRYKKYIGKNVILPIVNKEIPIIADDMVDVDFGTGAVKITPAHDPTDFEVAKRHNLRVDYKVIEKTGIMNAEAGIFSGMNAMTEARDNIVELLRNKGNLVKIEPYTHKVGFCSRGNCRVESVVSVQWFVKTEQLAKKVLAGYEKKEFEILPERFNKVFENWMTTLRDWCISRQLWWGHQIPAYYDSLTGALLGVTRDPSHIITNQAKKYALPPRSPSKNYESKTSVAISDEELKKYNIERDGDVLDTWFSSALWPFSILEWDFENPSELFNRYYPANVLETGYDILFFWIIRMLLFGYEYTDQTPFKTIYLHGLVFDEHGKKMSKSWGNVIDPIDVIDTYSADALRLALVLGNTPGNNINFSMKNVEEYSLFLNKFWNIIRFAWMNIGIIEEDTDTLYAKIAQENKHLLGYEKWILSRLSCIIEQTKKGMDEFSFSTNGIDLLAFIRDEFADFAIEAYKIEKERSKLGKTVLAVVILEILALIHPYIPHISEALYGYMTHGKVLINQSWPLKKQERNLDAEHHMHTLFTLVHTIRNIRAEKKIKPSEKKNVWILSSDSTLAALQENQNLLQGLAKIETLSFGEKPNKAQVCAYGVSEDIEIYIDAAIDTEELVLEKDRLEHEIEDKKAYIRAIEQKTSNPSFVQNAPEAIVRAEMEKNRKAQTQLEKLEAKYTSILELL